MKTWMRVSSLALLVAAIAAAPARAAESELALGAAAPPLSAVTWVKGQPVASWQPGHVYVLDFWATWCGPCKRAIPHINEVAKGHRDRGVSVIGVAVWPRKGMVPTDKFVEEKGDGMAYLIAEDVDGATAETFMEGTLSFGIPTIMIIDQKGALAWVGSPSELDGALAQVLDGTLDRTATAKADDARREEGRAYLEQMRAQRALNEKAGPIMKRLQEAQNIGQWAAAVAAADQLLALVPSHVDFALAKYDALLRLDDPAAAHGFGKQFVTGPAKDSANDLNTFSWWIVDPAREPADGRRDLELALIAAEAANAGTGGMNPSILDTLARVHFLGGDVPKAVELQRKAVELMPAGERAEFQATLDAYIAAAG